MPIKSLIDLVIEGAGQVTTSKTAVGDRQSSLNYGSLLAGAEALAAAYRAAGIRRGDRLAVWMDKSPQCVQAILGAMWCGAAYVPLDPRSPWRRCRSIVQDCQVAGVVVDQPRLQSLPEMLAGEPPELLLIAGEIEACERYAGLARHVTTLESAIAGTGQCSPVPRLEDYSYILYTSGSTGTPKGVVHTHRSALGFVQWSMSTFQTRADDVFSSHAPFHFDLSVFDLYTALGSGATTRLISSTEAMLAPYLVNNVGEWGITVWYSTPSILSAMLENGNLAQRGFGNVRVILFAGEVFPTPQLIRLERALPGVRLFNLFGPTETNVCTYYEVPDAGKLDPDRPISIGRGCENLETFVVDDQGREVADGEEGILWVVGDNLMSGYWGDSERTARMLLPNPRGSGIACRTGDRVRRLPGGNYDFLGRVDHMVKTRGYRVELGEVEAALNSHPAVLDAVAVAVPDERIGNRIAASVVLRSGQSITVDALRTYCSQRLPSYMLPEQLELRDELPRTSTGKADRSCLLSEWKGKSEK